MHHDHAPRIVSASGDRSIAIGGSVTNSFIHTGDLIIQVTHAIGTISNEYRGRIERFLREYTGSAAVPRPFGGRDQVLEELDLWIDDTEARPYLLLAAPAGRGKSALLVHWSQRQLAPRGRPGEPDLAVVFFPVSIRFNTSLAHVAFLSLVAQLAALHGEEVSSWTNTPVEVLRDLLGRYLARPLPDRKRLLLVLDGVDEAADWEVGPDLFPYTPPDGVRVVVSARLTALHRSPASWIEFLGWDLRRAASVHLAPLDPHGVADVLARANVSLSGGAEELARQLHRLSEGDPLLVRLYVEELGERGGDPARLEAADLGEIRPGLEGYFRRWWEDQIKLWGEGDPLQNSTVRMLLSLLSCALGPLRRDDLFDLAPAGSELDTWTLEAALRPLERFVVGDGDEQGYVFAHPRLGEYFYGRLSATERAGWEARYLAWGKSVLGRLNDGRLAPEAAPPYTVQYLGAHLTRTGATVADWVPLVGEGWWRAWLAFEGNYSGFLTDVDRAWAAARVANRASLAAGEPALHLALETLCKLCHDRISALSSSLSPELVAALVRRDVWTMPQALAFVQRMQDLNRKVSTLLLLLECSPALRSDQLIEAAVLAVQQIETDTWRIHAIGRLAPYLSEPLKGDLLAEALHAVGKILDDDWRVSTLGAIAPHLPGPLLGQALEWARQIENTWRMAQALEVLLPYLPQPLLHQVYAQAERVESDTWRAKLLSALVPRLPEPWRSDALAGAFNAAPTSGEIERGYLLQALAPYLPEPLLDPALQLARKIGEEGGRARTLAALAPRLPEEQRSEVCARALNRIVDDRTTVASEILEALVPHLSEPRRNRVLARALQKAREIFYVDSRAKAVCKLAPYLSDAQRSDVLAAALKEVRQIEEEWVRAAPLKELALHLPEPQRREVLAEGLRAAELIPDDGLGLRSSCLKNFLPHLPESLLGQAFHAAQRLGDEDRAGVLRVLTPLLPKPLLGLALQAAQRVGDEDRGASALGTLAPRLPEPGRTLELSRALQAARETGAERKLTDAVGALAPHLPESLLGPALDAALEIREEGWRTSALETLAPHLPEPLLARALEAVVEIRDDGWRTNALEALIPHLPEALLAPGLKAVLEIPDEGWRAQGLRAMAPRLPEPLADQALQAVFRFRDEIRWAGVLEALGPLLPEPRLEGVLREVLRIRYQGARADALLVLAPHLHGALLEDALRAALQIGERERQARLLGALASRLDEPQRSEALAEAVRAARQVGDGWSPAPLLGALVPRLPEPERTEVLGEALNAARRHVGSGSRASALGALAPHLAEPQRSEVLAEALEEARREELPGIRVDALTALAPHFPELVRREILAEALQTTLGFTLPNELERHLEVFAAALPTPLLDWALREAQQSGDTPWRATVLRVLVPHLPEPMLKRALAERSGGWPGCAEVGRAFAALVSDLSPMEAHELWSAILAEMDPSLDQSMPRLTVLAEALGGPPAVEGIWGALSLAVRWWP